MRSGELLGLQHRDVDPLHGTVTVERQPTSSSAWVRSSLPPSRKPAAARSRCRPSSFMPSTMPSSITSRTTRPRLPIPSSSLCTGLPVRRQDLSHRWTTSCAVVHRGRAPPRPPAPRRHRDRSQSQRHLARAHGNYRPFVPRGRPPLPARHRRAQQGIADYLDGVITRRECSKSSVAVQIRP